MSTRYRWSLFWSLFLCLAAPLGAQANSVEIRPIGLTSIAVAPYSTTTQRFWVVNTGTQANQYGLFANVCAPYDLYCEWSNPFLGTIAFNDSVPVDVKFTAGAAGSTGTISFEARINTNQSVRASRTVTVTATQVTHLEVAAVNPGAAEERDLCLTVAVATDAAYECGDLRLVHALPSVRARGTVRTPTLLYNSRFAHPFGLVAATFSTPPHDLTSVTARLRVPRSGGDIVVSQGFSDALFTASTVRKFVLAFDAGTLPTGVYPYTLTTTFSLAGTPDSTTASGELIVVNWKTSPFGAGWWLAGYERIYAQADGSLLWVGGDGSARHYTAAGSGIYRAPGIDHPDSITVESGNFVRHLRGGARVEFSPDGKHFATSDRLGLVTFFHHDQYGQMAHIDPAGFAALRYDFAYSSFTGPLETVTAPAVNGVARVVQRYVLGDGRILSHTDPDSTVVQFGFDATIGERITARTNRRGVVQSFAFDAVGKLVAARVPLTASDTAVTTFCPAESRGFVSTGCSGGPLAPDSAVTVMDGPRTDSADVTTFRLDRFGAPRLVRDAIGNQTQLFRGNRDFPGIVTRVVHANGWVNDAFQDAKGLVTKTVQYAPLGPGRDAVTEYTWDPKWERVTQVSYPEGNFVRFGYDSATGNRIWQEDGRGAPSRVAFAYDTTGAAVNLLRKVTYPMVGSTQPVEQFEHDATLGNLSAAVSPLGTRSTIQRDAVGRDTSDVTPVDSGGAVTLVRRRAYDVMDQVTLERTVARGDTVTQVTTFDPEGNPLTAQTTVLPDRNLLGSMTRRYTYDLADRRLTDSVGTRQAARWAYDRAGNDTLAVRPGSMSVRTTFDALGRPAQRQALGGVSQLSYDAVGNLVAADNPYARVRRSYFANGLLRTDSLRIATADTSASDRWTAHVYGLTYAYDLNGRRLTLSPPGQLVPGGATPGTTEYAYDSLSGALTTVSDPFGNQYRYGYDALDRLRTYSAASFATDTFTYDLESRLTRRTRLAAGQPTDVLVYDLRGKVLANTGSGDAATYLPIGPVKTVDVPSEGRTDQFTTDALGHRRWSSVLAGNQDAAAVQWSVFEPVTARLLKTYPRQGDPRSDTTFYFYEVDGSHRETNAKHFIWNTGGAPPCAGLACLDYTEIRNTLDDYDGEGHLATSTFLLDTLAGAKSLPVTYKPYRVYTTYRYDALGRRVWARTMRGTNCAAKLNVNTVCVSTVTRTVWDGAQVLFELRATGDSLAGGAMENDAGTGAKFGVVGYVHGLGIDQPLAIFKGAELVVPHATWRGVYDRGSCLPSSCPAGLQFPGGNGSASVWGPTGVDPDKADWYGSLIWDQQDATGYQYKRNRYYDPGTGRFTQEDPIGLAGGMNLYGFANGDAVNFADPFGLWPCPELCAAGGLGAVSGVATGLGSVAVGAGIGASAPIAIAGGIMIWASQPVRPTSRSVVAGALVSRDITTVALPSAVEMGKLSNKLRAILTGILIGRGGGLSDEQLAIRLGGAKPVREQIEEDQRRIEQEKKRGEGSPPKDPPDQR